MKEIFVSRTFIKLLVIQQTHTGKAEKSHRRGSKQTIKSERLTKSFSMSLFTKISWIINARVSSISKTGASVIKAYLGSIYLVLSRISLTELF